MRETINRIGFFSCSLVGLILSLCREIGGQPHDLCFQDPSFVSLQRGVHAIVALDADGDGKADLISLQGSGVDILFMYGRGDGDFETPPVKVPAARELRGLAIADFNSDGQSDVVVNGSDEVMVLLANGPRSYAGLPAIVPVDPPAFVTPGDFNEDGKPDLVIITERRSDFFSEALVHPGNGDGTFGEPNRFDIAQHATMAISFDGNADTHADLAIASVLGGDRAVYFFGGNGDGTFGLFDVERTGGFIGGLDTADVNGDAQPDILVTDRDTDRIILLMGDGKGEFDSGNSVPSGSEPRAIKAADVNADGASDLIVSIENERAVWVLLNKGTGTFFPPSKMEEPCNPSPLIVNDLDGDGKLDLAVGDNPCGMISVRLGCIALQSAGFIRCDPNADGRQDIADSIWVMNELFRGGLSTACQKAADCDDNGLVDLSDGLWGIQYQLRGGPAPLTPFPSCGQDPTPDDLTCTEHFGCR